jgi:hypothetical protein
VVKQNSRYGHALRVHGKSSRSVVLTTLLNKKVRVINIRFLRHVPAISIQCEAVTYPVEHVISYSRRCTSHRTQLEVCRKFIEGFLGRAKANSPDDPQATSGPRPLRLPRHLAAPAPRKRRFVPLSIHERQTATTRATSLGNPQATEAQTLVCHAGGYWAGCRVIAPSREQNARPPDLQHPAAVPLTPSLLVPAPNTRHYPPRR